MNYNITPQYLYIYYITRQLRALMAGGVSRVRRMLCADRAALAGASAAAAPAILFWTLRAVVFVSHARIYPSDRRNPHTVAFT